MTVAHNESNADEVLSTVGAMIAKLVRSSALESAALEPALGQLTENAAIALRVARTSVWRFNEDRTQLECLDLYERESGRHSAGIVLHAEATPRYFHALELERTISAEDARHDPRTSEFATNYLAPLGITAMLDAPIWLSGRLVGVVCHEHVGDPRVWAPWEELVAGTFGDLAAMVFGAVERARQARALADYGTNLEHLVEERTRRLAEERRFLQTVIATAPFGLAFFDLDGRYVGINDWLAKLNGVSAEDSIGKRPTEVLKNPAAAAGAEYIVAQVLQTGKATEPIEVSHEGVVPESTYLIRAYPITTATGVANVGCSVVEITAQRENERERIQLLERERKAREEAEAANRAKDEFLAMLGHELRNPLAPILTALNLMERLGSLVGEERAVIARQVGHLNRLVDDLLDVARITSGKITLEQQPIELMAVVIKGIELASPLLERRRHFLEVNVPETGLIVHGDLDRLAQVVSNLLTNAAKFTAPGGRVVIAGRREGQHALLTVRDTGSGIPTSLLPQLFDAFVQGERMLDRSQGGLGLGLAIVRGIVAAHGGEVTAHSEGVGLGSEFVVTLPAFVEVQTRPEIPGSLRALSRSKGSKRILVVDDNEDAARMLALVLEQFGHVTSTAFDGPSAVTVAREFSPQAALLDLGLPVMDGVELAGRLRELPGLSEIKLVAVTGYGRPGDRARTKDAGFHEHIVKPIEIVQLEGILTTLFESSTR